MLIYLAMGPQSISYKFNHFLLSLEKADMQILAFVVF